MKGGKFLGEGTYGCSLDPAPKCVGNETYVISSKNPKKGAKNVAATAATVGKVFIGQKYLDEEWDVAKDVAQLDPQQKYFIYPLSRCKTSAAAVHKVEGQGVCNNVATKFPAKSSKGVLYMAKLPNGGEPLDAYVKTHKVSPEELLTSLIPVVKGIQKLSRNDIVHHDLKFDNILYNTVTNECRIIDFGLKVAASEAFDINKNKFLFSNYWLHPTEYKMYVSMHKRHWTPVDDAEARMTMARHLSAYKIRFSTNDPYHLSDVILNGRIFAYCEYEKAYIQYMKQLSKQTTSAKMIDYLARSPDKIDVFSLGITLVYLSMYLDYSKTSEVTMHKFYALLRSMIHPDPRYRASSAKCLKTIKDIIGQ